MRESIPKSLRSAILVLSVISLLLMFFTSGFLVILSGEIVKNDEIWQMLSTSKSKISHLAWAGSEVTNVFGWALPVFFVIPNLVVLILVSRKADVSNPRPKKGGSEQNAA
jgi:hypothetical protein